MPEVPKIVRERLKADNAVQNHPDPDLLTAFAEKSLSERERNTVLSHLTRCGDCRDIVALALPEPQTVERTLPERRSAWLTWPALRWGLAAVGVVIVASLGVVQYHRSSSQALMLYTAAPRPEPPRTEAKAEMPSSPAIKDDNGRGFASNASTPAANAPIPKFVVPAEAKRDVPLLHQPSRADGAAGGFLVSNGPRSTFKQQVAGQSPAPEQTPQMFDRLQEFRVAASPPASQTASQPLEARSQSSQAGVGQGATVGIPSKQLDYSKAKEAVPPSAAPSAVSNATSPDEWAALKNVAKALPGQMGGYVVDPSGAGVGNAQITLTPSIGGSATTVTDSQGRWIVAGLPSGDYQARAQAPGFQTASRNFTYDASRPSMYVFPLSVGSASETVEVTGGSPAIQTETAVLGGPIKGAQVGTLSANGRSFTSLTSLARWTISAAGALQRSLDQGKTWQDVNVFANAAPVANFTSTDASANAGLIQRNEVQREEKDAGTKSLKRQAVRPLTFRAVTANGAEVWAGGSNTALFHSADGGNRWARVLPSSGATFLTGDVIGLEFSDALHGSVTTSTSEVWTTADSGQTWQKQ